MVATSLEVSAEGDKKKIGIELPFYWSYESFHDENIDRAIEEGFNYDYETGEEKEVTEEVYDAIGYADIDWTKIRREYAKHYVEAFGEEFGLDLEFDDLYSPQFYNYGTERVFAWVPEYQINKIRKEVEEHEKYPEYIREKFTDRSGFWSNYSSDYRDEDWTKDTLDECQYQTIIEFWLENINPEVQYWVESESFLTEDFEMCNWDSIIEAQDKVTEYMKCQTQKS